MKHHHFNLSQTQKMILMVMCWIHFQIGVSNCRVTGYTLKCPWLGYWTPNHTLNCIDAESQRKVTKKCVYYGAIRLENRISNALLWCLLKIHQKYYFQSGLVELWWRFNISSWMKKPSHVKKREKNILQLMPASVSDSTLWLDLSL